MTGFRNLLLPPTISIVWRTAPGFSTRVTRTANGKEKRRIDWDGTLARGFLRYDVQQEREWQAVDEMFQVCYGMAYSFMVRDPRKNVAEVGEGFFVGGQAVLRISRGGYSLDKTITKLDATATIVGGTVDVLTGISPDGATGWSGKFYLCCRFDTDELELTGIDVEPNGRNPIAGFKDVPIVEVLGE